MPEHQETLLEFPCRFPIKALGKAGEDFGLRQGLARR
jgi:putative lipoic acid-binding regulatory protein